MKAGFVLSPTLVEACRFIKAIFTAHLTITSVVALTAYRRRRRYNLLKVAMIGTQGDDNTCLNPGDQIIFPFAINLASKREFMTLKFAKQQKFFHEATK